MPEQILIADAYKEKTTEEFPCLKCGKLVALHYNGGELDSETCCEITYSGRAKGFEIIASS